MLQMSNAKQKVAVVTGSSSGIGFETSLALARSGYLTYATMRNLQKSKELERIARDEELPIKVGEMDVDNDQSVKQTIAKISENGKIDVLVNNAGYGLFGALEDMQMDEIKRQYETNVFGLIRVTQNVLPIMRSQKSGIIVNISSLAGVIGVPAESVYASTKFAVEGLSESLSFGLERFGIKVILIEPGVINTEFVQDLVVSNRYGISKSGQPTQESEQIDSLSPYRPTIAKFLSLYFSAMSKAPLPKVVAEEIIKAIEGISTTEGVSLLRVPVGNDAKKYGRLKREMTDNDFHQLLKKDLLK